jgi:hypothetical protein
MIIQYDNNKGERSAFEIPKGASWKVYAKRNEVKVPGVANLMVSFSILLSYKEKLFGKKIEERIGFLSPIFVQGCGAPESEIATFADAIADEFAVRAALDTPVIDMTELIEYVYLHKGIGDDWVKKGYVLPDEDEE